MVPQGWKASTFVAYLSDVEYLGHKNHHFCCLLGYLCTLAITVNNDKYFRDNVRHCGVVQGSQS